MLPMCRSAQGLPTMSRASVVPNCVPVRSREYKERKQREEAGLGVNRQDQSECWLQDKSRAGLSLKERSFDPLQSLKGWKPREGDTTGEGISISPASAAWPPEPYFFHFPFPTLSKLSGPSPDLKLEAGRMAQSSLAQNQT